MSTSDICKICKDSESTKSNDDNDACEVTDVLQNLSTGDEVVSICANCGKEGSDINNICNKCKQVKYCNAACKKKHRHKHKKECEEHLKLAAEHAAELHDKELFKQPPPQLEDCPICFLPMPSLSTGKRYQSCCGKFICCGCVYAPLYDNKGNKVDNQKCAYCRTPYPTSEEEAIERNKKRMKVGDPIAIGKLGSYYRDGSYGFPQDINKALEFWQRAAELGYTRAYNNIGNTYYNGDGVKVDREKANHYYELASMGGCEGARYNLGAVEEASNMDRALKHHMIAVRGGENGSLKRIKWLYSKGHATKEDYTKALRLYQEYLGEIKSVQRDKAAAADESYQYH